MLHAKSIAYRSPKLKLENRADIPLISPLMYAQTALHSHFKYNYPHEKKTERDGDLWDPSGGCQDGPGG